MRARVILKQKNIYEIEVEGEIFISEISGNIKNSLHLPIVGDFVNVEKNINSNRLIIKEVIPRENSLIRPLVANVDQAVIINSYAEPTYSSYLIDKMLAIIEFQKIKPLIVITKIDLIKDRNDPFYDLVKSYENDNYEIVLVSNKNKTGIKKLHKLLSNKTNVMTGQSGVGKSSTLNSLDSSLKLKTQQISKSLNRGKHTTRFNKIYEIFKNTYIIDTPGFSSIDINISKEQLRVSFSDFEKYSKECKFNNCLHQKEMDCNIKLKVNDGIISKTRYKNYLKFLDEKNRKEK